ncbi:MAG: hypothetical protein JWO68_1842, partial [Actinomycetia bacterium]|nr:hypothetical protein [Actinomycetes bacterium]
PTTRQEVDLAVGRAARRATDDAPVAYVRFEPGDGVAETRATTWPGGEDRLLATSGFHGTPLTWRGDYR